MCLDVGKRDLTRTCRESVDESILATLLWHLFHFVQQENEWPTLLALPLDNVEEAHLIQYLTAHAQDIHTSSSSSSVWECLIAYYLQRSRFSEAIAIHRQLNTLRRETEATQVCNALLDDFALLLPPFERPQSVSSKSTALPAEAKLPLQSGALLTTTFALSHSTTSTPKHVSRLFRFLHTTHTRTYMLLLYFHSLFFR
jgi:hypothetical protein